MKATGILRRVDDLGRVVIPREIRHNLGIKEGDSLEIFLGEEGEVIFKPYRYNVKNDLDALEVRLMNAPLSYTESQKLKKYFMAMRSILTENGLE